jgi:hydroxymethylglutaryl-CoA lyase
MIEELDDSYPEWVDIIEVGPRDGLQRESVLLSVEEKLALINALTQAGLRHIQVTSFVHPRLVPQMADAEVLCAGLPTLPEVIYSGMALNVKGVERAKAAGLKYIDISISASDAHSQRNTNRSVVEALAEFGEMYHRARAYGMKVRGGIQCAFGYERSCDVSVAWVVEIATHYLRLGVDELTIADSAGLANPRQMTALLGELLPLSGTVPVVLHLHDTRGMGLANVLAALHMGIRHFDTAFGGLGGCPFIDGAAGNIATEDVVYMLHEMGIDTGIDVVQLAQVSRRMAAHLGKERLPSKLYSLLPVVE